LCLLSIFNPPVPPSSYMFHTSPSCPLQPFEKALPPCREMSW